MLPRAPFCNDRYMQSRFQRMKTAFFPPTSTESCFYFGWFVMGQKPVTMSDVRKDLLLDGANLDLRRHSHFRFREASRNIHPKSTQLLSANFPTLLSRAARSILSSSISGNPKRSPQKAVAQSLQSSDTLGVP